MLKKHKKIKTAITRNNKYNTSNMQIAHMGYIPNKCITNTITKIHLALIP